MLIRTIVAATLVVLTIPASAQAPSDASKPAKSVADPDKVRCKTTVETGSLAKTNKVCHTNAEWRAIAQQGKEDAEQYRNVMNSSRGGG